MYVVHIIRSCCLLSMTFISNVRYPNFRLPDKISIPSCMSHFQSIRNPEAAMHKRKKNHVFQIPSGTCMFFVFFFLDFVLNFMFSVLLTFFYLAGLTQYFLHIIQYMYNIYKYIYIFQCFDVSF